MKLFRLVYIVGILLVVYGLISGLQMHFISSEAGNDFSANYSLKVGALLIGLVLVYLARKLNR